MAETGMNTAKTTENGSGAGPTNPSDVQTPPKRTRKVSPRKSIDERMLSAHKAIHNSLEDPVVLETLSPYGYNETKINEGKTLYEELDTLIRKQKKEYGDQYEATNALYKVWGEADGLYMNAVKVARVAFKDNTKAQNTLRLFERRKQTISGWLEQATVFYNNLVEDEELKKAMALYGYNDAKLTAERGVLEKVIKANRDQDKEVGDAQQATKNRDEKMDALDDWMSDFIAIARVAFTEKPQLLEKLGILVPS
jgi:hypothetical protein